MSDDKTVSRILRKAMRIVMLREIVAMFVLLALGIAGGLLAMWLNRTVGVPLLAIRIVVGVILAAAAIVGGYSFYRYAKAVKNGEIDI